MTLKHKNMSYTYTLFQIKHFDLRDFSTYYDKPWLGKLPSRIFEVKFVSGTACTSTTPTTSPISSLHSTYQTQGR